MNTTFTDTAECADTGIVLGLVAGLIALASELLGASDCKHNGLLHAALSFLRREPPPPDDSSNAQ